MKNFVHLYQKKRDSYAVFKMETEEQAQDCLKYLQNTYERMHRMAQESIERFAEDPHGGPAEEELLAATPPMPQFGLFSHSGRTLVTEEVAEFDFFDGYEEFFTRYVVPAQEGLDSAQTLANLAAAYKEKSFPC